ncbi:MAG: bifunctional response regulator/alkaline phosphatase family protein [Candidatus Marinimicrobia bacterium]|nr:bifunctional response regulator/alkaline phosphatase family protein [Candidatus Neomarinimicrobiota bacterium]
MEKFRGKILWVDDEIEHLKPHILFLEEKGYAISTCPNGRDGIAHAKDEVFDLVLLDQFMPGMDGMDTLREIKENNPVLPVIMITKSEEEWLMDEAISEKIAHFLIKPVNPNQIFMACKQVLEDSKIRGEKTTSGYLQEFQKIELNIEDAGSFNDWWKIYNRLVKWQLDFEEQKEVNLQQILNEQIQTCNRKFTHFIQDNYKNWLTNSNHPKLSPDVFRSSVQPLLEANEKVCLLVMDAMRLDQFMALYPLLAEDFYIKIEPSVSILPSATPFSRNAIFSGLFPDEFCKKYPQQLAAMVSDQGSLNHLENEFLRDQLTRSGLGGKSLHYHKIWIVDEGQKFQSKVNQFLNFDLLAIVVNFVDQLAHRRSESDVLKEMVPDETGYRQAVKVWYTNSWIRSVLSELGSGGFKVVMTSDHGSLMVNRSAMVAADKHSSSGVRYKYGRNINANEKSAVDVRNLNAYRLPSLGHQNNYLLAKDDFYFLYPNEKHKYKNILKGSFQHGGISMEEMMVPIFIMDPK